MDPIVPKVELYLLGSWVDVSEDVVSNVRAAWGIFNDEVRSRVADPGSLSFDLDNSEQNSGGVRGYYSPDGLDVRGGFGIGVPVRFSLVHDLYGTKVKWQGTVEAIRAGAGPRFQKVTVDCVDWMDEAARAKLSGLTVETDIQSDALFSLLVDQVESAPPAGTEVGSGSDVYPYALDNTQDESSRVSGEFTKLAASEFGLIYVSAGKVVFEGRRRRGGPGSTRLALDDLSLLSVEASFARDDVKNRVQVQVHPRRVDAAATSVLFSLGGGSGTRIERKTSVTLNCPYRDPNQQAQRVGGVDMVTPVITTDYLFNTAADGSGTDISSQLSVQATFGGNSATVVVLNNGPVDGYLTKLQLRGKGVYDFEPVLSDVSDSASTAAYGENVYTFDMPYQSSPANALDTAQYILGLNKDPRTRLRSITFLANWSDEFTETAFNIEISERVSVTVADLGLDAVQFYVNGVRIDASMSGLVRVTWYLAPVDTTQFWLLEVDGRTELDETTVLGYGLFVAGWVLETSALNTDAFLN